MQLRRVAVAHRKDALDNIPHDQKGRSFSAKIAIFAGLCFGCVLNVEWPFKHVFQHGHMWPQIEALKRHGKARTHPLRLPDVLWHRLALTVLLHADFLTCKENITGIGDHL